MKSLEFPTITICFDPATKLSVSKKYGFKTINDKFNVDIDNLTMHDIFDEVTYQMGSDYVIKNYNGPDIKLGLNQFNDYLNSQKLCLSNMPTSFICKKSSIHLKCVFALYVM